MHGLQTNFQTEQEILIRTWQWANESVSVDPLVAFWKQQQSTPLICVGSGGSLTVAAYMALMHQAQGTVAKHVTPWEFFNFPQCLSEVAVVLPSAGGKNRDVLNTFDVAVCNQVKAIHAMCGCFDSPLAQAAKAHSTGSALEFDIPTGKDGFLATVSLVAFMGLLLKAYQQAFSPAWYLSDLDIQVRAEVQANIIKAMPELAKKRTWMIVYGGWGLPVALDAECKLTEAAMVSTRLIDYRNLAHGHHHWLHRYGQDTAVIALVTPNEAILAEQTLALLPSDIPTLSLTTAAEGPLGTLALMVQLIALVYALGDTIGWSSEQMPVASFAKAMQQLNYQIPMAKTVS